MVYIINNYQNYYAFTVGERAVIGTGITNNKPQFRKEFTPGNR